MPQDTISVNLTHQALDIKHVNYYQPLLVYKCSKIKVNESTPKVKILNLNINSFEKQIDALEKEGSNGDDEFNKEKEYLKKAIQAFFSSGDAGLKSVKLLIYKDSNESKEIKNQLQENRYTFVTLINTYSNTNDGGDGLTLYKDDYTHFKADKHFFVFATKESEIKELFKNGSNSKEKIIVIHSKGDENLHLRFISKYLHEASIFQAANPYGLKLSGMEPITDDDTISKLRGANINFYSLLNETGLDGVAAFKEAVTLEKTPIDELFTYHYIKYELTFELIRVWNFNGRQNSKLSALQLDGKKDNAYTTAIQCKLKSFIDKGIIVSYSDLSVKIEPSPSLKLLLSLNIVYNFSMNSVLLNITSQDIGDYLNTLSS
ncbi:DUF787 family protein [Borrelia turicatae]|uniref:DUF787 family protein n=1 Tax=Borrelia turicatae TaxID=142 RepID=UPI001FF6DE95|nr:DUF787 family protein [Borrelia turicatae]UPA13794.1 DUF787 family protein [Borrelia turicatae 91E135]UPA13839.1 DUF787 family protein [Borrelia turicatae 91E135]UPA13853.1 DUF787 family protein [Borrelia turicatae 91E135]UPA13896.1 DUF787 family protein [Borrelia turicatae 91E135]UPA15275.1 DUF787 family protein [Borrelia turicatae]